MTRPTKPARRYIRPLPEADAPFLADILAAPHDDAPLLVYADHLLEQGDEIHGELIGVQCTVARLEREGAAYTPEYRSARARERELLAIFADAWSRTFGMHGARAEWERGFLTHLTRAPVASLREHWPIFARQPLASVAISEARAQYPLLADLRWLKMEAPTLETIRVSGREGSAEIETDAPFTAEQLPAWAHGSPLPDASLAPFVSALKWDHFSHPRASALASTELPLLRRLSLSTDPRVPLGPLHWLGRTSSFGNMEHLAWTGMLSGNARQLLERPPGSLRALTLAGSPGAPLDAGVAVALAESPARATLEEIRVTVEYTPGLIHVLGRDAARVERLTVGAIGADGLEALASCALPARLRHLEVSGAAGGKPSASPLARAPFERLLSLLLVNLRIDADLAASPALETLVTLRCMRCEIAPSVKDALLARWPHARFA